VYNEDESALADLVVWCPRDFFVVAALVTVLADGGEEFFEFFLPPACSRWHNLIWSA